MDEKADPFDKWLSGRLRRARERAEEAAPPPPIPIRRRGAASRSVAGYGAGLLLAATLAAGAIISHRVDHSAAPALSSRTSGSTPTPNHPGIGIVPWVDVPGTKLSVPPPGLNIATCSASALHVDSVNSGGVSGYVAENVQVSNIAAVECQFTKLPSMVVSLAGGGQESVSQQPIPQPVNLLPSQTLAVGVGSPVGCSESPTPPLAVSLDLTLSDGSVLSVNGLNLDVECGAPSLLFFDVLDLGNPPVLPSASLPPGLGQLGASASLPGTASRGSDLSYTITLTNPSSMSVILSPCPSYTEGLNVAGSIVSERTLLLNCNVVTAIAANSSLTFQMRLPVPASLPAGTTKFFWRLEATNGPIANGVVNVP